MVKTFKHIVNLADSKSTIRPCDLEDGYMNESLHVMNILNAQTEIVTSISQQANITLHQSIFTSAALASVQELTYLLVENSIPQAKGMKNSYTLSEIGLMAFPTGDKTFIPSMYVTKQWEPKQTEIFRSIVPRGGTFLDLGAHVGWHTFSVARFVPEVTVISVEASEKNAKIFELNRILLGLEDARIVLINSAAWNRNELLTIEFPDKSNSGDTRVASNSEENTIHVNGLRLDDLDIIQKSRIDVIKSDLQGVDQFALEGLSETISRHRPTIIVEFWPEGILRTGSEPLEVLKFYRSLGYEIYDLDKNKFDDRTIDLLIADGPPTDTDLLLLPL